MPSGEPIFSREKDRACYLHQLVEVDLTVVTARVSRVESRSPDSRCHLSRPGRRYHSNAWNLEPGPSRRDAPCQAHYLSHSVLLDTDQLCSLTRQPSLPYRSRSRSRSWMSPRWYRRERRRSAARIIGSTRCSNRVSIPRVCSYVMWDECGSSLLRCIMHMLPHLVLRV